MVGPSVIGLVGATTATSAVAVPSLQTSAKTMVDSCCSMNGGSLLYWASSTEGVSRCVLKIGLQSTRIYMRKEEVSERRIT